MEFGEFLEQLDEAVASWDYEYGHSEGYDDGYTSAELEIGMEN